MDIKIQKIKRESLNISDENRRQLKTLFPSVFAETMNEQGEPVESIDFEKLKAELGAFTDLFEGRRERYGMEWPGKKDVLRLIQISTAATLKPCRDESVNFDTTENLFIEGDNLEVLKLLQKSYYGKVKMIYIDPPYNTGKELIYPDNFTDSLGSYLEYAGLADSNGKKFSANSTNEGRFHTKWLNMTYPRLYLARNLLRDDGVIFISIDDNEVSNLRKLCDEIFGEENFIAELIWKSRQNVDSRSLTGISNDHEYILCFSKTNQYSLKGQEINKEKYNNPDNDPRGNWMSSALDGIATKEKRPNLHYTLINPLTGINYDPSPANGWRFQKSTMTKLIEENRILWPKNPASKPRFKRYLNELNSLFTGFPSLINGIFTLEGTRELREIMGMETVKFPKPVNLIKKLIQQASEENEDIILDFFAGSATTAHAVLDLNKQDGGNRKFILVQLPEPCAPDSEAFKAGYKSIADIGKERIRRVIKKFNEEDHVQPNGDGKRVDRGFKVLKLSKSNFKQWQKLSPETAPEEIEKQLELHVDHIDHKSTTEDLLYEILLKEGYAPTEKIEAKTMATSSVFSIAGGKLLICLDDAITKELINAVVEACPEQFICLDSAFCDNDQLKANAAHAFSNINSDQAKAVIFKTV